MLRLGKWVWGNILEILKLSKAKFQQSHDMFNHSKKKINPFSPQRIFNYFPFWQSKFELGGHLYGGETDYSSERISLLNLALLDQFIHLKNLSILELAPLEGGNTLKLCQMGARHVTAIEGRVENFIKCCVIKNLLGLDQVRFFLDDVRNISKEKYGSFDVALVAGILYHLNNPHVLLHRLSRMTDVLLVATHYADETSSKWKNSLMKLETEYGTYHGKVYSEGTQLNLNSGLQPTSFWPFKEDLFRMCRDIGFHKIDVIKNNPRPEDPFKLIYFIARK